MAKAITIEKGKTYTRMVGETPVTVEVLHIEPVTWMVEFMVTGEPVQNPEVPRKMFVSQLAKWLGSNFKEQQ